MTMHTPGPWRADMHAGVIWGPDDRAVVRLLPVQSLQQGYMLYDEPRLDANARLIALAPEMADVLRDLADARTHDADSECVMCGTAFLTRYEKGVGAVHDYRHDAVCPVTKARALLARLAP